MEKNYQESNLEIRCGKETDSYDKQEELCEKEDIENKLILLMIGKYFNCMLWIYI